MENIETDKKTYELSVLAKTEDDLPGLAVAVGQHNAELVGGFNPKRIALAYPIKKQKDAVFAYCTIRASGADAKKLEEDLRMRHDVLRFLIISTKAGTRAASPQTAAPIIRKRPSAPVRTAEPAAEPKASQHLSNEALEKKIEEILQ